MEILCETDFEQNLLRYQKRKESKDKRNPPETRSSPPQSYGGSEMPSVALGTPSCERATQQYGKVGQFSIAIYYN